MGGHKRRHRKQGHVHRLNRKERRRYRLTKPVNLYRLFKLYFAYKKREKLRRGAVEKLYPGSYSKLKQYGRTKTKTETTA